VAAVLGVPAPLHPPADPLATVGLSTVRLSELPFGSLRFQPVTPEELYSSIFTLWNVLDAIGISHNDRFQVGAIREVQLRKMVTIVSRPNVRQYCEIGMNGGHSVAAMLSTNPDLTAHVWDLLDSNHSRPVAQLLSSLFGDRFMLHAGDTHQRLRPWARSFSRRCDMIFIDGDHTFAGARQDIQEMAIAAAPGAPLVVDDLAMEPGEALLDLAKSSAPLLSVPEQYGPYPANSSHNPCLRTLSGPLCIRWGFAVARYRDYSQPPAKGPSVEV